ncbi:MAG: hypothetical protein MUF80_07970 [Burkholderiales bacterium]|nr:hypothetical protein [Burkholderiales bacterium]
MSENDLKAGLERLRNENASLKKGAAAGVTMKVSEGSFLLSPVRGEGHEKRASEHSTQSTYTVEQCASRNSCRKEYL